MLDERKTSILRAIVNEYIETAQPVGSSHVAKSPGINVSSATIRNEMAVLELEGYLVQPHTSAGRIPTDKGYRVFVDTMTHPGRLDQIQTQTIRSFFASSHGAVERMLSDTSRLLANLTDYAAVVVGPTPDAATVRSVQLVSITARLCTLVVVMSNGSVEHGELVLPEELPEGSVAEARVAAASAHLSGQLVGRPLHDLSMVPSTGDATIDALCAAALSAIWELTEAEGAPVFVGGASRMAAAFEAVEIVRRVLLTLEEQVVVVGLVRDVLDRGLSVAIGAEHGVEPLAACSVVVAPYVVDGEHLGSVGVLGPTRMNYPQALAAVEVVSEKLGRRLGDG